MPEGVLLASNSRIIRLASSPGSTKTASPVREQAKIRQLHWKGPTTKFFSNIFFLYHILIFLKFHNCLVWCDGHQFWCVLYSGGISDESESLFAGSLLPLCSLILIGVCRLL